RPSPASLRARWTRWASARSGWRSRADAPRPVLAPSLAWLEAELDHERRRGVGGVADEDVIGSALRRRRPRDRYRVPVRVADGAVRERPLLVVGEADDRRL